MSSRFTPPPRYNADVTSPTSLTPYLQLPHILSLTWLAYPIISLLFVIFRLQISSAEAQSSVANAKDDLLTACLAAEQAATAAASMPRYLAISTNQQFADAVNGGMNGAREALILALTCMEAIINFLIGIYRSTFLCFLELVVVGGLDLLISAVQEITSFLQNTLNSIVSGLKNDATSLNSAIQTAVNSINSVNPFGKIQAPQFNISSLDAISNITIPTDFETALIQLNNSLPSISSIKDTIEDLVDTPFEAVKADINNTFLGLSFDPELLPVPQQNTVSFCSSIDTLSIDNLGDDLLQITKIGTIILLVVLLLLIAGHCVFEWYKWRCLMRHLRFTREAWMSDPATRHVTSSGGTPSVALTDHNLLMLQTDAQHPLLTRIAFMLTAWLRLTSIQHVRLRWFLHYIFHPPALACFLIGFFGLLSVQIQLIAVGPLEAQYSAQVTASVQDLSDTIATQMNNSMYNQSVAYASGINVKVETVQSTINNGLFGWVNSTTTTLNDTLNNFYDDVQSLVGTIFNGTILETPAQDFVKCLIGSKVNEIEKALTFLNQNLNVDLPMINETVLVLSPSTVDEITQPIATAAVGGTSGNSEGLVGRLVATYVDSLKKERLMFSVFMGLWGVVVLMGLVVVLWHSCIKNSVNACRKRKWQREQQDALEGFAKPFGKDTSAPHVGDTEKGLLDHPLRSFTPLPEAGSPFSITASRRLNLSSSPASHPLKSLHLAFERSWDSLLHEGANKKSEAPSVVHRSAKPVNESSWTPANDSPHNKFIWFKSLAARFSRKDAPQPVSGFIVSRPTSASPGTSRPQLTISVAQASAATPKDLPRIDTAPSPTREVPPTSWSTPPAPPKLPWVKNIPPRKVVPLYIPPPPPNGPQKADIPPDVGSTAHNRGPLALPLHNAFEERPDSQRSTRPPILPTSDTSVGTPHKRHKHSSTAPVLDSPPLASRHESTRSMSRLLTNMFAQSPGEPVDPFATPFDDDVSGVSPVKNPSRKRITNPFAGFAL